MPTSTSNNTDQNPLSSINNMNYNHLQQNLKQISILSQESHTNVTNTDYHKSHNTQNKLLIPIDKEKLRISKLNTPNVALTSRKTYKFSIHMWGYRSIQKKPIDYLRSKKPLHVLLRVSSSPQSLELKPPISCNTVFI